MDLGRDRTLRGAAAIVGVTDAVSPTGVLDLHGRALEADMVRRALDDAGLTLADVDGVCHTASSMAFAEYLGIHPSYTDSTMTGGSSFEVHVEHAAAAIAAGLCDVVIGVYASMPRGDRIRKTAPSFRGGAGMEEMMTWEAPYGLRMPMGPYALAANRPASGREPSTPSRSSIARRTRECARWRPMRSR
jgi:acetyl-CoA acetyltransferase